MPILRTNYTTPDGKPHPAALTIQGPRIEVLIGSPPAPTADTQAEGQPPAPMQKVYALIDTGATAGAIDEEVAKELGLRVVDRKRVGGITGQNLHDVYMLRLTVPGIGASNTGPFTGVKLGRDTPVILGRDFLSMGVFVYDGRHGQITVCV